MPEAFKLSQSRVGPTHRTAPKTPPHVPPTRHYCALYRSRAQKSFRSYLCMCIRMSDRAGKSEDRRRKGRGSRARARASHGFTGLIDFLTNEARLITVLFLGTERRARAELESGVAARLPASMKDSPPHDDDDDEQDREHESRTSDDDDGGTFYGTDDVDGWQLRRIRVAGGQVYQ